MYVLSYIALYVVQLLNLCDDGKIIAITQKNNAQFYEHNGLIHNLEHNAENNNLF